MKIFVKKKLWKPFEECEMMGTLEDVLEESWHQKTARYKTSTRQVPVTHIRTNMTTPGRPGNDSLNC